MEDNLLASIFNANRKIKECLDSPLDLTENRIVTTRKNPIENEDTEVDERVRKQNNQYDEQSGINDGFIVSVIGVKQVKDESAMFSKNVFIVYEISVTRIADGCTKSVFRRFRQIKKFYHDVSRSVPSFM
jgi:hypothetical protein